MKYIDTLKSLSHLRKAWDALNKQNKLSRGISTETIESFSKDLSSNLKIISRELKNGKYKFSLLRGVAIPKKEVGKFRPLRIPEVRDRVVLKAITMLIQPKLEKKHKLRNDASFAYQKGLGVEQAILRMKHLYEERRPYALECDILKFFDTIDTSKLLNEYVYPTLKDDTINHLIEQGLKLEIGNADQLTEEQWQLFPKEGGIPQGSALSPLLSNIYLSKFDHEMLKENFGLVRYADDFIVMCRTEEEAFQAYEHSKKILESELKLKMHDLDSKIPDSKCRIVKVTQRHITFLSICFNGKRLWPEKKKLIELREKIKMIHLMKNINIISYLTKLKNLLEGWLAAFHFTDLKPYLEEIDDLINIQIYKDLELTDWKLKKQSRTSSNKPCINERQRMASGVPTCKMVLSKLNTLNN